MNLNQLRDLLEKIPFSLLMVAYLGSLGWDYYGFKNDAQSPLAQKHAQLASAQEEVAKLNRRVKETQEFIKTLDLKRLELRKLAQDLEETRTTLSDSLDTPAFMKALVTEAQRSGLTVTSIKPKDLSRQEYYAQQAFEIKFRGVYPQLIAFLDRAANMQRIARVDNFSMKPITPATAKYVTIEGSLEMKAYYYIGTKADEIAKGGSSASSPQKPAAAPGGAPQASPDPSKARAGA